MGLEVAFQRQGGLTFDELPGGFGAWGLVLEGP